MGNNAYAAAGIGPTYSELTLNSISPVNNVSVHATVNGAAPNCGDVHVVGVGTSPFTSQVASEVQAIGCKTGYLDSILADYKYTFTLNTPGVNGGSFDYVPALTDTGVVVDTANAASGDTLCATNDTSAPSCAAAGGCNTTAPSTTDTLANIVVGNKTSATTTINVTACPASGMIASTPGTATLTLKFAPGFISTQQATPVGPTSGWDFKNTGAPLTAFNIPASATQPWGQLAVWQVLNLPASAGDTNSSAGTSTAANAATIPSFFCWAKNAVAACPAAGSNTCSAVAGGNVSNGAKIPVAGNVSAGDSISIIGCQDISSPPPVLWTNSDVTNVAFSGPGQATAPTVSAPTANPYNVQASLTVTNNDALDSKICYTYSFPATTPTCSAGTCTTPPPANGGASEFNLTAAGSGATASKTFMPGDDSAPGSVQLDNYVFTAIACNATESSSPKAAQTYNFQAAEPDFSSSASGNGDLDTVTTVGADEPIYLSSVSNFNWPVSGRVPTTGPLTIFYTTDGSAPVCGTGNSVSLGLSTDTKGNLVSTWSGDNPVIAPATGASFTLQAVTCGQLATDFSGLYVQKLSAIRKTVFTLTAGNPTITTSQDPGLIAYTKGFCSATLASCGTIGNPPCCSCDGDNGVCGTAGHLPCCCSNDPAHPVPDCTPQAKWENTVQVYVNSPTSGNSICVATGHKPTCTAGACGADQQVPSGSTVAVTASNTTVWAVGCKAGLAPSPNSDNKTFDLASTPAALVAAGGGACGTSVTLEDAVTAGSAADADLGGASPGECFCYTTDGSPPGCSATNCASTGSTTCDTGPQTINVPTSATVTWATCALGFDTQSSSQFYSTAAYSHT
ncbi:MAG: hypothetical protein ACRELB_12160, partial [Polyangiaceae bacterium]